LLTQLCPEAHSQEAWQRLRQTPLTQSWSSAQSMFWAQVPLPPVVPPLELEVVGIAPVVPEEPPAVPEPTIAPVVPEEPPAVPEVVPVEPLVVVTVKEPPPPDVVTLIPPELVSG
jgi:hypothetical protein